VNETPTPTPRELEILKVLWEHGPSSVRRVHRILLAQGENKDLAYNTVQTLLRIMEEKKSLVEHHVEGRTFVYAPCYSRDESAARFLDRVFDGAADQLVLSLLRSERISPEELERMQFMIDEARRKKAQHKAGRRAGRPAGDES
jgi:predicted transcriptional regulator